MKAEDCLPGKSGSYGSEREAREQLAVIRKRSSRSVVPVRVYRCNFCKMWHLTSQPLKPTNGRRRRR